MPADVRLLATDLDGTLIGRINEFPLYSDFRKRLRELRSKYGTRWVACSGRTRTSFNEFFAPMRAMDIRPEFIIVRHAYIYGLGRMGYRPHVAWNWRIRCLLWRDQRSVVRMLRQWHRLILGSFYGVHVVRRRHSKLCFGFDAEQSAVQAAQVLTEAASSYKHLRVFRYAREVDIRAVPFTKGLAVSELASHLAIPSACILAIGNGHNDISMLDGAVAGMTGCPANSEPEVVEAVSRNGGHVAKERSLTGVLEILSAYAEDKVSSALPADWVSSSETENPNRQRHARGSSRRHRTRLVILIGAAYAVFLVLLHFEILPFGRLLMKPFERAVSLLAVAYERVVTWLF